MIKLNLGNLPPDMIEPPQDARHAHGVFYGRQSFGELLGTRSRLAFLLSDFGH
ncbi:hypothetical protein ABIC02_007459 [Bradyrhizobium sp. RT5a]